MSIKDDKKKAIGVPGRWRDTNMGIAWKDYSFECKSPTEPIIVYEGFWIWWCEVHYQPLSHCDVGRQQEILDAVTEAISGRKP